MVATDTSSTITSTSPKPVTSERGAIASLGSITLAALALPGVLSGNACAESAPEEGVVAFKLQSYRDWQPGLDRIKVTAPSLYVLAPFAGNWSVEASAVQDSISGASPRWHSSISGASHMHDRRNAGDVKLTRYFDRAAVGVRFSTSNENDYRSNAIALDVRMSSADNNTTWVAGIGGSRDAINPVNGLVENESKRVNEFMVGVTQAVSRNDLAQFNLTHVRGRGYFNDPYKLVDNRPRERNQSLALLRWNHFLEGSATTLRGSYRYYSDSYGVRAHTVHGEWVVPFAERFRITPTMRYYSQRRADFYFDPVYDPVIGEPYPVGNPVFSSPDTRLSSFGALTFGAKFEWMFAPKWTFDLKYERYEQRSSLKFGGGGSPGISAFRAEFAQVGISRRF